MPQPWIQDALARKGRWADNALDLTPDGTVSVNKFDELPVVREWPRRPLELATLQLQRKELPPDQEGLDARVLTQLGACIIFDGANDKTVYSLRVARSWHTWD